MLMALMVGVKKIFEYAAPPSTPKNCDFAYPTVFDATKLTNIAIDVSEKFAWEQRGGVMNDASCLNKTSVYGVIDVRSVDDVKNALKFARDNHISVTAGGAHHSMGGQSFSRGGLVLDMKGLRQIAVDEEAMTVHVESGATWADVQKILDAKGLSVKAMQSINIFTVGGTLSVNAHGIAHDPGSVASTVRQMHVMLANGEVVVASPTENADLFHHVLGGYGLFGVILDADLDVVKNEMYDWETTYVDYKDFPEYFASNIDGNDTFGLAYARLSISPSSYLTETAVHVFQRTLFSEEMPPLVTDSHTALERFVINFSKTGRFGKRVRWALEKHFVPSSGTCISRNNAMSQKEVCLVSRNQKMFDSMGYLRNRLKDTDILQEYFVVPSKMTEFVDGLRSIVQKNNANLLNVTIRIVPKDSVTALPYAKEDMLAFVLYFNQKLNVEESSVVEKTTIDMIDLTASLGGTFYLPYQLYYSPEQLRTSYPEVDDFFAAKRRYDSEGVFSNAFYEKYGGE